MNRHTTRVLAVALTVGVAVTPSVDATAIEKKLDLSQAQKSSVTEEIQAGKDLKIEFTNVLPWAWETARYRIDIDRTFQETPPFSVSSIAGPPKPIAHSPMPTQECIDVWDALNVKLKNETETPSEGKLIKVRNEGYAKALVLDTTAGNASCTSFFATAFDEAVTAYYEIDALRRGEQVTLKFSRLDKNGNTVATWQWTYRTPLPGRWQILYGFNFIPNEDEEYFTELSDGNTPTFTVRRQDDNEEFDFAPSIYFTWLSRKDAYKKLADGPTAGLGFDFESPVVFVGWGWLYRQNVMATVGAVFHEQTRLDGRFRNGETIGENLDSDQLTEETYDINYYVGLAFRFGESPFKAKAEAK